MGLYRSSEPRAVARLELRDRLRHARVVVGEVVCMASIVALGLFLVASLIRVWVAW